MNTDFWREVLTQRRHDARAQRIQGICRPAKLHFTLCVLKTLRLPLACQRSCDKFSKPRFGLAAEFHRPAAPDKAQGAGVKRLVRQNEPGALLIGQAIFNQRQVQVLVAAVQFVANDGVAEVGEVDADLMFAAGAGDEGKQAEG